MTHLSQICGNLSFLSTALLPLIIIWVLRKVSHKVLFPFGLVQNLQKVETMADCWMDPIAYVKEIGKNIITQCQWPPIKSHIDYWWCFDNNIQGLKDGIRDLDRETVDMRQRIEEAGLCIEKLRPGVEEWSNAGTEKLAEARKILQDDDFPKAWNLISRYSMGKSAKKAAEEIVKLLNDGNFNRISDPMPPPSMGSTSHRQTMDFESRKRTEEEIIESLRNSSINIVGICGMGGVGKTTMVQRIRKRVKDQNLFHEVVMVVASQQIDMYKIQKEIAELLGLKFDVESMSARAVRTRLMDSKRKIIIFDDVWESLELENLGVPFEGGFERCKILLTTRSKDLCIKMEVQKVIALKVLTKEEAWNLFKEKTGNYVENSVWRSIAEDVVAECKGLPIALVTVGKALRSQTKSIWKDSLSQLRTSNPMDFPEVLADVYGPLKLSYDYLDNERERLLFMLCCLFPEDYNIPVEHLTLYVIGLRMFDGVRTIEESRNRTYRLVEKLKSRFLLIDGLDEHHVKMHDVVRDVAIFIGSEVKHGFLKSLEVTSMDSPRENTSLNRTWMSMDISNVRMMLPVGWHFPHLRLLMMLGQTFEVRYFIDIYFEGMEDLNVMSFSEIRSPSLPRTLGLLKNLRTLHLYRNIVRNISVVGELSSLEILCCCHCPGIEELPAEIGKLHHLRLLELYDCIFLQKIAFGVISSFVRLEELNIYHSFRGWEAEKRGKESGNAELTELQSLRNLTCLQIEIDDWNLAAQEMCLSQNLVKCRILIFNSYYYFDQRIHERVMDLTLPRCITVGNWILVLARNTEYLALDGVGSNNINVAEIENLRSLIFDCCPTVKKLVNTIDCKFGSVFPLLEALNLFRLPKLEEICDGTIPEGSNSFHNLKQLEVQYLPELTCLWKSPNQNVSLCNLTTISIWKCSNLRYLFSVSIATSLLQLEVLQIQYCDAMEEVFWNEIKGITNASTAFPMLNKLTLRHLPNLVAFCRGIESIQFPKLIEIEIGNLSKLNSLSPLSSETPHDNSSFHFLCNQEVEMANLQCLLLDKLEDDITNIWCHHIPINFLRNLKVMRIFNSNGIRNLMSSSIANNLVSLYYLSITSCLEMVEVIEDEEEVVDISLFPTLHFVEINNLPKLRNFCQWRHGVELPSLGNLKIDDCPRMETFTLGSLSIPSICYFTINQQQIGDKKDLNGAIHAFWTESQDDDHLHLNFLFEEEKEEEKQEKIREEKEVEVEVVEEES